MTIMVMMSSPALTALRIELDKLSQPFSQERTQERLEGALAQAKQCGEGAELMQAHLLLACWHYHRKEIDAAAEYFGQTLIQAQQDRVYTEWSRALNGLGLVAVEQGRYAQAQDYYRQSLALSREHQDLPGIARVLNNMALMWSRLGQPEQALEDLLEAQETFLRFQHPTHTFVVALNLLWTLIELKQYERAYAISNVYLSLAQDSGSPEYLFSITSCRMACQGQLGQKSAARLSFKLVNQLLKEHPHFKDDAAAYMLLALGFRGLQDDKQTLEMLKKSSAYAKATLNWDVLVKASFELMQWHQQHGDQAAQQEYQQAYLAVRRQLFLEP